MTLKQIIDRLGTGERWWAAEVVLRLVGLALISVCVLAGRWLYGSIHTPPPHEAGGMELVAAAVVVTCGLAGGMLALVGPSMFERVPIPSGSRLISWSQDDRPVYPDDVPENERLPPDRTRRIMIEFWLGAAVIAALLAYQLTHLGR